MSMWRTMLADKNSCPLKAKEVLCQAQHFDSHCHRQVLIWNSFAEESSKLCASEQVLRGTTFVRSSRCTQDTSRQNKEQSSNATCTDWVLTKFCLFHRSSTS